MTHDSRQPARGCRRPARDGGHTSRLRSGTIVPILAGLAAGLGPTEPAAAQDRRGFRFGIAIPVERTEITYEKAVDNTNPGTLVPAPRRGNVFEDEGSASGPLAGLALLAGYRWPLGGGTFLSAEADFAFHRGTLEAQLEGSGTSPSGRQLGEVWPDDWSFEKRRSFGVTLRLGGSPGGLGSRDESVYVLAGLHRVAAEVTVNWHGCLSPIPCTPDRFTSRPGLPCVDDGRGVRKRTGRTRRDPRRRPVSDLHRRELGRGLSRGTGHGSHERPGRWTGTLAHARLRAVVRRHAPSGARETP